MKKIVPFKKDFIFDTNIDEINSISLEYEISEKSNNLISGKFIISGDYKMTSTGSNLDAFNYELPFNINIDKKYDIDSADIDINDFYYEVVDNKILSINIELVIDKIEDILVNDTENKEEVMDRCIEPEDNTLESMSKQEEFLEEVNENVAGDNFKTLFDNLDGDESYSTYKIHIIRENDTIESIIMDYEITKESLGEYNNLSDIKIGDKLIIPADEN